MRWYVWFLCCLLATWVDADRDLYSLLGVPRTATERQIKKRFRAISRQLHPDVNPEPSARERYAEVLRAYSILDDPAKRRRYDEFGIVDEKAPPRTAYSGGFNPFFRRQLEPILSVTKLLTISDYLAVLHYRGYRLNILQVYHDQDVPCHLFSPTWEYLVTRSSLRHVANFWRIDLEKDQLLLQIADISVSMLPMVVVVVDGELWTMPHVPITNNIAVAAGAVEQFASTFMQYDVQALLDDASLLSVQQAEALVAAHTARLPLVFARAENRLLLASLLGKYGHAIELYAVPEAVFTALSSERCKMTQKWTVLWMYHTFSRDLCRPARYPGASVNEDAVIDFVASRLDKPLPILSNSSFIELCAKETDSTAVVPCVIELVVADTAPVLVDLLRSMKGVVQPAVVNITHEAAFWATVSSGYIATEPLQPAVLFLRREGDAIKYQLLTADSVNALRASIEKALRNEGVFRTAPLELGLLQKGRRSQSTWHRISATFNEFVAKLPAEAQTVAALIALWVIKNLIFWPKRAQTQADQADDGLGPGRDSRPANTAPAGSATTAATSRGGGQKRTGPGPQRRFDPPGKDVASRLPRLGIADIRTALGSTNVILVLAFAVAKGVKAPAEAANVARYPDVILRTVAQLSHAKWWGWLREHASEALAEAESKTVPLFVAVRCGRRKAALLPLGSNLQLWIDQCLDGQIPFNMTVDPPPTELTTKE